ncbi:kinase-like protein [Exidia glandulosa HHB12029]|uniref:non-specific serine/threonine protein kinase n=1 Tax=Exidia glandulosa HHB12029 TaxID=1314781 RepID=A0A165JXR5_EXIGL|nr:kinase-like protein [Exidia glandulosa HHB12029]
MAMALTLRLKKRVGAGAVSTVYGALDSSTDRMVAVKKSRVSQRAPRPALRYEAAILRLLRGHPSVPSVLAYSHLPHFEYLAMEMLGASLSDALAARGPLPIPVVANVAMQMVDALEHLHGFGLVHRDIKPGNILFKSPRDDDLSICLIDYGMVSKAAHGASDLDPQPHSDITGTLPFASLRAHVSGQLYYRDDLESLAYTLFELALGSLPWSSYCGWRGTYFGRVRQVYQQKKAYDGERLGGSLPKAFADLLDTSRHMSSTERPAYDALRAAFSTLAESHAVLPPPKGDSSSESSSDSDEVLPPTPPIEVGQVVWIEVAPRLSVETPELRGSHASFIPDPTIDDEAFVTVPRLGVITSISWERDAYKCNVVGIGCLPVSGLSPHVRSRPIGVSLRAAADVDIAQASLETVNLYTFFRPATFYTPPTQAAIPRTIWVADAATAFQELAPARDARAEFAAQKSPDADVRYDARIQEHDARVFATLAPVADIETLLRADVDGRGWFDEYVQVVRRLHMDEGEGKWTGTPSAREHVWPAWWGSGESYQEADFERWQPVNVDRSASLTLGNCEGLMSEMELLEGLNTIDSVVDEVPPDEDEWFSY